MSYLAPNFTQIPNLLLEEHIKLMTEAEMRVALAIARKTFGWHKRQDRLSLSQLMELTGMSRQGVINGIEAGITRGIIRREQDGQGYLYELVIIDGQVNEIDQSKSTETSQRSRPELVNEVDQLGAETSQRSRPTKERNKRNKLKKGDQGGERARVSSPAPPEPVTPDTPAAPQKPLLPNDSYDMSSSVNGSSAPSPNGAAPLPRPRIDGRKWRKGGNHIMAGKGETPVEVWYESFSINDKETRLTEPDEDDLAGCTDLPRFREVVTTFRRCNFNNKKNIQLLLEWYNGGIPERYLTPSPNGTAKPAPPETILNFDWDKL